jgi:Type VI secretion system VasI, EvfG, VC_A0118
MRALLTVACASLAFIAAEAQGQDLKLCRQIKDDAARLKCYDGLGAGETGPQAATSAGGWEVTAEKSAIDDSPIVSAALRTDDGKAQLILRCRERKTQAAVIITGFINCGTSVRVIYRLDQDQPVEGPWNSASSCYLAIAPSPIPFIRSLKDQGKAFFRLFDHHGTAFDASFNLGKVSEVSARIAKACEWDTSGAANPAPNAPAAASSPSKASPK